MTHPEYLEAHHAKTEAAFTRVNALLGSGKADEAKTALEAMRTDLDALWAIRRGAASREVAP